ncbi:NAD(P)-binding protein [Trematosphaeria pertusa]|uniref:NAD(P)-binding protein n=1 Tax=Trematosphaeria pertusa TaxID=390896 RepID=A0A6A6IMU7_9PLEO|nr:NAD(P)-binding protein [Trematosphaeria pertusa]KAF2251884.1 NAD(P)-binding protein [Trematosphaeria pertusa]
MRFLIIGASGRVGELVVQEALSRGHSVTALVRNPSSLSTTSQNLTIVTGTPLSAVDVGKAFTAVPDSLPAAVIVTLNNARASDSPFAKPTSPPHLMHDAHINILSTIKTHSSTTQTKLVTLQAQGVGSSYASLSCLIKPLIRYSNMGVGYQDHEAVDQLVRESGVNFVMARPTRLAEGERKALRFFGDEGEGIGGFDTVSKMSVAGFLVDAAEGAEWDGRTPVFAN